MTYQERPSFLDRCDRASAFISGLLTRVAMLMLGVMTIFIAMQVASRNFLNVGLPWADELARFTGLALVFFTIPLLQCRGKHVAVDLFTSKVTGLAKRLLEIVNEILVFSFCAILLYAFYTFLKRAAFFSTPATGMPNWVFYSPALLGVFLCALVTAIRLIRLCSGKEAHIEPTPESIKEK